MQKNKIFLASLISLLSLNAAANTWMPNKVDALACGAGALVVTTGVLLYQVYQLKGQVTKHTILHHKRTDDVSRIYNLEQRFEKLQRELESKPAAAPQAPVNLSDYVLQSELGALENRIVEKNAQHIERCATTAANAHIKESALQSRNFASFTKDFYLHKINAEQNDKTFKAAIALKDEEIEKLNARLTKLINENKSSNQAEIEAIKKELATFAKSTDIKALSKQAKENIDRIEGLIAVLHKRLKDTDPTPTMATAVAAITATADSAASETASAKK